LEGEGGFAAPSLEIPVGDEHGEIAVLCNPLPVKLPERAVVGE
jgi:hypothetical protein